ncbi:hypothetical protein FISHEDRAFT_73265 [Fistulina hepatica ATCC 64428]|uniref:Uncharacterized protein n=1 Tax=Fistulina hepatica ATCC 64428 TaxID=1128425 RepID=A0A0D7ACY5_9AGAR|nr:hypothetical protein FISHEDRAFT_73265 [Fistulina hepatica ATCC 64428]
MFAQMARRSKEDVLFPIASNSRLPNVLANGLLISDESLNPPFIWGTKVSSLISSWHLRYPVADMGSIIIDSMSHRTAFRAMIKCTAHTAP